MAKLSTATKYADENDAAIRRGWGMRSEISSRIHSGLEPATVRRGEGIRAVVIVPGAGKDWEIESQVWRISPLGAEIVLPDGTDALIVGKKIDVKILMGNEICDFRGLVVDAKFKESAKNIIGVRWCLQEGGASQLEHDRRDARRWLCGSDYLPTGMAANPVSFNDFIIFQIRDVSAKGIQFWTSLRNKFLIPGMFLDATISFPLIGQIRVGVKIVRARLVQVNGKDYLSIGAEFKTLDRLAKDVIGQYVLQFCADATVKSLKDAGLGVSSSNQAYTFSYVNNESEFREVLELRRKAYGGVGKVDANADLEQLTDVYDTRARILTARHHGKLVASMRLMYHGVDDQMEHEQFVKFPDYFPRKEQAIEITRVCTDPDYRGSDLLMTLFKHATKATVESKRPWVIGSADSKNIGIYAKMGFTLADIKYTYEGLGNSEHQIFYGNVFDGLSGRAVGPIVWNIIYGDVLSFVDRLDLIHHDPLARARISIYSLLGPIARLLYRLQKKGARRPKES